jgi:hypothetical protein
MTSRYHNRLLIGTLLTSFMTGTGMAQEDQQRLQHTPGQPIAVNGIRTGMTLQQARRVITDLTCQSSVVHGYPVTGCHPESLQPYMTFGVYRGRVYAIKWYCSNDGNCNWIPGKLNAHFGRPRSDRTEIIKAQSGAFREHVIRWRASQEGAMFSDSQLSILNYAFAPPGEDFVKPLAVGKDAEDE